MDTVIVLGLGFLAFLAFQKSTVVSNLKFVENGIDFNFSNVLRPQIYLHIIVQNPTSGSVLLQSLAGYFSVNGVQSGNVSSFIPTAIGPNSQTVMTLTLSVNDAAVITDILNFIHGAGKSSVNVAVEATANIDGVPVPVSLSFNALPAFNNMAP